jgi:hypothetical protein
MLRTLIRAWRALTAGRQAGRPAPPDRPPVDWDVGPEVFGTPAAPPAWSTLPIVSAPPPAVGWVGGWAAKVHPARIIRGDDGSGRDLPADLSVPGTLRIIYHPRLRSIGDGLCVGGDLQIGGDSPSDPGTYEFRRVPIRALPRGLRVGGSLELRNCFRLERLPDDLSVGGSILLEDCDALAALPDRLVVSGPLTIKGGQSLAALPTTLRVTGDFRLSGTRVTTLPADLVVSGSLVVEGRSRLAAVPAAVQVGEDVVLRRCPIESFPAGVRVGRTLRLIGCRKLVRLPDGLHVPDKLDLSECTALESLPRGLTVGHSLKLKGCTALRSLPDGLTVPRTLDLRGCTALTKLPGGLRLGFGLSEQPLPPRGTPRPAWWFAPEAAAVSLRRTVFTPALRLADCPNLTELPDDLQLGGPIEVAGSGLRDLPRHLAGARVLWRGVLVPADVVFHPERVAPLDVLREPNAELRRVMMERVGVGAVLAGVKAETRDEDVDAGGPRRLVYVNLLNRAYLLCRCPSTARQYLLRVPPDTRTARHAAAWMAGFDDPDRYRPAVET